MGAIIEEYGHKVLNIEEGNLLNTKMFASMIDEDTEAHLLKLFYGDDETGVHIDIVVKDNEVIEQRFLCICGCYIDNINDALLHCGHSMEITITDFKTSAKSIPDVLDKAGITIH